MCRCIPYLGPSKTTNCVANDKDCCPRQTLSPGRQRLSSGRQTLSSTTKSVADDNLCLPRQSKKTNLVAYDKISLFYCRQRQRAEDMGCLMMGHHYIDIIRTSAHSTVYHTVCPAYGRMLFAVRYFRKENKG